MRILTIEKKKLLQVAFKKLIKIYQSNNNLQTARKKISEKRVTSTTPYRDTTRHY